MGFEETDEWKAIIELDIPNEKKIQKIRELVRGMDAHKIRQYLESTRLVEKRPVITKDADKVALMEFENLNQEFMHKMFFLNSIYYLHNRLEKYGKNQEEIKDFLDHCFGIRDNHLGEIAHLVTESAIPIPDLPESFVIKTSFEQVENSYNHYFFNYDPLRVLVKHLFGLLPTFEASIYFHGLFTETELKEYYESNRNAIKTEAITVKVGAMTLVQPFKDVRDNVMTTSEFGEVLNRFSNAKDLQRHAIYKEMQDRMKTPLEETDPETINHIKSIQNQLSGLETSSDDASMEMKTLLMKQMTERFQEILVEDERMVKIATPDGEKTIKMKQTELDLLEN